MEFDDKDEILSEIDAVLGDKADLDFNFLISVIVFVSLVLLLAFPKVFLHSSIYYKSRDISALEREYKSLKEEHKLISTQVEQKRFKNQILDTLF